MNKRIDLTNLGGFPLEQDTLKFMQDSYDAAFQAVAKLCGDKTILFGVVVTGGNVSSGWISYNGELLPFIGGALGAQVVIAETSTSATFEDGTDHEIYFTKTATCGAVGSFPFSDLVPLLSLQNVWRPGDIKDRYCDAAYIEANFDGNGYGVNAEKGWRILRYEVPGTAGRVAVDFDPNDPLFQTIGNMGGAKTQTISKANLPNINLTLAMKAVGGITADTGGGYGYGADKPNGPPLSIPLGGSGIGMNVLQPYFIILKLIKL